MGRRVQSARSSKGALRLAVEILEDRLPVSENFGTLLAVSALAGWADTMLASPHTRELADRRIEATESSNLMAPNGLTLTENLSVAGARSSPAETASRPVAAIDSIFASVASDFDADAEQQPFASTIGSADSGHGSDSGPQSPLIGAGTVLASPMPAYSGGVPASGQMPATYSGPSPPISAAPTTADQQLTQAANSAAATSGLSASGVASAASTPRNPSGPLSQGGPLSPQGAGFQPSGRPLTFTFPGADGVVPEMEDG